MLEILEGPRLIGTPIGGEIVLTQLPIDVVPNTAPPIFKWRQEIETLTGKQTVEMEGMLPATVEGAVKKLIEMHKKILRKLEKLEGEDE